MVPFTIKPPLNHHFPMVYPKFPGISSLKHGISSSRISCWITETRMPWSSCSEKYQGCVPKSNHLESQWYRMSGIWPVIYIYNIIHIYTYYIYHKIISIYYNIIYIYYNILYVLYIWVINHLYLTGMHIQVSLSVVKKGVRPAHQPIGIWKQSHLQIPSDQKKCDFTSQMWQNQKNYVQFKVRKSMKILDKKNLMWFISQQKVAVLPTKKQCRAPLQLCSS